MTLEFRTTQNRCSKSLLPIVKADRCHPNLARPTTRNRKIERRPEGNETRLAGSGVSCCFRFPVRGVEAFEHPGRTANRHAVCTFILSASPDWSVCDYFRCTAVPYGFRWRQALLELLEPERPQPPGPPR